MVRCDCASIAVTFISLILASPTVSQILDLPEGSSCQTQDGVMGKCVLFSPTTCPSQHKRLADNPRKFRPVNCGFKGMTPIICCEDTASTSTSTSTSTSRPAGTSSGTPVSKGGILTERKAEKACREMDRQINASFVSYILGGNVTERNEFPHMVALGYRDRSDSSKVDWACGGSLISNEFVLTAAHCVYSIYREKPHVVRVGVHNLSRSDEGRQLRVLQEFVHPNYTPAAYYDDMALLKIPNVNFDEYTAPICLWTSMDTPKQLIITGWGSFDEDFSKKSEILLKADLVPFSEKNCSSSFSGSAYVRRLSQGLASYMICARGGNTIADTCGGDSGGPLQSRRVGNIPYHIVGITSFGPLPCGKLGVYDRVASFLDWIEPYVWPD